MAGLFDGTPLERPVTCDHCGLPRDACACPRDADGAVLPPADQRLTVRVEKRRRGKVVTVIRGLEPHASDVTGILRHLKQQCAAGGAADADGLIAVQGDHRERVADALRALGYPVA